jgi:hypothetical protein
MCPPERLLAPKPRSLVDRSLEALRVLRPAAAPGPRPGSPEPHVASFWQRWLPSLGRTPARPAAR